MDFAQSRKRQEGLFPLSFSQASKAAGLFLGPNRRRARPAGSGPTEFPRARWCPSRRRTEARPTPYGRARLGAGRALRDATLQRRLSVSSRPLPPSSSLAPPARRLASLSGRRWPAPAWVAGKGNAVASWFRPRRLPGRRRHGDVTRHQTDAHWTFLPVFEYDDPRLLQCKKTRRCHFF
jgi:hypothetical protein